MYANQIHYVRKCVMSLKCIWNYSFLLPAMQWNDFDCPCNWTIYIRFSLNLKWSYKILQLLYILNFKPMLEYYLCCYIHRDEQTDKRMDGSDDYNRWCAFIWLQTHLKTDKKCVSQIFIYSIFQAIILHFFFLNQH